MNKTKPFSISKKELFEAWKQVKRNKGSHGIDNVNIDNYEENLKNNLYKLWNAISSGTYFPKEVRNVKIPKSNKEFRKLGIPTINDRIAQTLVTNQLNLIIDPNFHDNSYGFRPKRNCHQALEITTERCWKKSYVINLDIKGLFDNIPHKLIFKSLEQYNLEKWQLLYIGRWLEVSDVDNKKCGTPQGGVISPLLANVFMDVCFDKWMQKNHSKIEFCRYADDCIIHCVTEKQVFYILGKVKARFLECGLELNADKTILANTKCKKSNKITKISFDFLGYTFKPAKGKNSQTKEYFQSFLPVISKKSKVKINQKLKSIKVFKYTQLSIQDVAKILNPIIRGWVNYYGFFNKRALIPICNLIDNKLAKYLKGKYKSIRSHGKGYSVVYKMRKQIKDLFAHWQLVKY